MAKFNVQRTAPITYVGMDGTVINGYRVTVYFPDFDEVSLLQVPDLNPNTISKLANEWYDQRSALMNFEDEG